MIVFDDSTPATQEKYYSLLEQTCTHNDLFYVGPREKEAFLSYLNRRLRDARLDGIVKNLFRPSYGGNRNCTLMYTLGGLMVSSDDDMRPYALMEDSPESLEADEVCRGRLHKAGQGHSVHARHGAGARLLSQAGARSLASALRRQLRLGCVHLLPP